MDRLTLSVAAKYKSKKVLDTGTVVYEYTTEQVAKRNREKAERVEKLSKAIAGLRKDVGKDLKSEDPKTRLTALAVALIDQTFERVGNDASGDEGHFGVTGWQKRHITFGGGKATINYVGKSGVKHKKVVSDSTTVKVLREAHKASKGKTSCVFEYDGGCVKAQDVNAYLREYDITTKDIRGFHANREMQERLKAIRSKGSSLPSDRKDREKQLKKEFREALEGTAKAVGHEASTLRSQYLVPALERAYVKDGTVISKLNEKIAVLDSAKAPLRFADRVVHTLIRNKMGADFQILPNDYLVIRSAFRSRGGNWEQVVQGSLQDHKLLTDIVSAWAQLAVKRSFTDLL